MTASLRQTATTVANSMIEGASMATALIGGAAGAYLGYQLAPITWSDGPASCSPVPSPSSVPSPSTDSPNSSSPRCAV
jgi:hypothetical protein